MSATSTITSRGAMREIDAEVLARLRAALIADRAPQAALVRANEATAQALTGQRDVDSILEREIAEASAARACESCRLPIPDERLEAIPHARTCVACAT